MLDVNNDALGQLTQLCQNLKQAREIYGKEVSKLVNIQQELYRQGMPLELARTISELKTEDSRQKASNDVRNLINQIIAKIKSISKVVKISNKQLAHLLTEHTKQKWYIVEGSEVWFDLACRCKLTGLYAINSKSKIYRAIKKYYEQDKDAAKLRYKTESCEIHGAYNNQYSGSSPAIKPTDIATDPHIYALVEESQLVTKAFKKELRQINSAFTNEKIEEISINAVEELKNDLINTNWIEPFLIKYSGLTTDDLFHSEYSSLVEMNTKIPIMELLYQTIYDYLQSLRQSSFILYI